MNKTLIGVIIGLSLGTSAFLIFTKYKSNRYSSSVADTAAVDSAFQGNASLPPTPDNEINNEDVYRRNSISNLPEEIQDFVPEGYSCIDTTSGDLNLDEFNDLILVLKKEDENILSDPSPRRPLLLLLGQDSTFKLVDRNDEVVQNLSYYGPEDPFKNITIKNGYFSVEHFNGNYTMFNETIITFKYSKDKNTWLLHKVGNRYGERVNDDFNENEDLKTVKDFGEIFFHDYSIYKSN